MIDMEEDVLVSIVVLSLFVIVGSFIAINAIIKIRLFFNVKHWLHTLGVISDSNIITSDVRGGILLPASRLAVKYEYTVNGTKYIGSRIGILKTKYESLIRDRVEELMEKYAKNARVDVLYNPSNHEQAILDCDVSAYQFLKVIVQILFGSTLTITSVVFILSLV